MQIDIIGIYIFFSEETKKKLESLGTVNYHDCMPNDENFMKLGKNSDAIITWGKPSAKAIKACKNLKYFGYLLTGYDAIVADKELVKAFKDSNIAVAYTPLFATEAVAEFTVAMTFALGKKVIQAYNDLKVNDDADFMSVEGITLGQSKVGVFGLGSIGTSYARKMYHMGSKILAYTPSADKKLVDFPVEFMSPEELFSNSDVLAVTAQLNESTRGIIKKDLLLKLKENAILLNTSRGDIFDLEDIYEVAKERKDLTISIDVIDQKSEIFRKLIELPNVYLTPHIAGSTMECMLTASTFAVANMRSFFAGKIFDQVNIK